MDNIIEKLGIKPYKDVCLGLKECEGMKIEKQRNEMLKALIGITPFLPSLDSLPSKTKTAHGEATRNVIMAIEEATDKSWEEVKRLLGEIK